MSASLKIHGILELKEELTRLPAALKGQATAIVLDTAHEAAEDIRGQYPTGPTGNLKRGVKVLVKEIGPLGVAAQVRSAAPHAPLWEFGTETRQYFSASGKPHNTGKMWSRKPATPVFIPTMERYRRLMYAKLAALIEAAGLTVTGDKAA